MNDPSSPGPMETMQETFAYWVIPIGLVLGIMLAALTAALSSMSDELLMAIRDNGGREAKTAERVLESRQTIQARLLAGRVLSMGFVATGVTELVRMHVQPWGTWPAWTMWMAVGLASFGYAFFSEAARSLARRRQDVSLLLLRTLYPLEVVFAPIAYPIDKVASWMSNKVPESPHIPSRIAELEVEHLIERREERGELSEDYADLLIRVLEFKDTVAREIMVPRTRLVALDIDMPFDEVLKRVVEEGHSRYPVYRGRLDKILGVLNAKDLFQAIAAKRARSLRSLLRKPTLFVAETQKIGVLLREMQARKQHLAIVVDEFGGTSGIVTLEDIVEEIVGEIQDEHDTEEALLEQTSANTYRADASIPLHELETRLDFEVDGDQTDFDSLGGLLLEHFGRVPSVGDLADIAGLSFEILEADERRILRVGIEDTRSPTPGSSPGNTASIVPSANGSTSPLTEALQNTPNEESEV